MKIAVLFDGAGLARLGLELAGHDCVGFELDPVKHHLSKYVGSGRSVLQDATTVDFSGFDAIWASPPCQFYSGARTQGAPTSEYAGDYLEWALGLMYKYPDKIVWVENVIDFHAFMSHRWEALDWGFPYNAAQFQAEPIQNRPRMIGGNFEKPEVYRSYDYDFCTPLGICPTITASEYKGCKTDNRRASRFYGRRLTLDECAYHMGFQIPPEWYTPLPGYTPAKWRNHLYEAIGNGVPVYMAEMFGRVYTEPLKIEIKAPASLWVA